MWSIPLTSAMRRRYGRRRTISSRFRGARHRHRQRRHIGTLTERAEDLDAFRRSWTQCLRHGRDLLPVSLRRYGQPAARRLVGIASVAGIRGLAGAGPTRRRSGGISYLESLRLEMRPSGIRVVTIAPGYIRTPLTAVNALQDTLLLAADEAARRFARAIGAWRGYTPVIPWQMGIVARVLRLLPNWLYDRLFASAPRKPRELTAVRICAPYSPTPGGSGRWEA